MDSPEAQLELSPETSPDLLSEPKKSGQRARSPAEWITLTLASLLLGIIVVLVLYDWQITKNIPPAFRIEIVEPARLTEGRYYVPFSLRNTGGHIARTVQVIAQLHLNNGQDETGEQQFDFLSGNERKSGSFVFEHDPAKGDLVIRVASFGLP
jgi:uncharacterized protein (TIGR02588 family)